MSRRRGEFEHRTSVFEGAFRAWSFLGGLEIDELELPVESFNPLKARDRATEEAPTGYALSCENADNQQKEDAIVRKNPDPNGNSFGDEYAYEPLPRAGLAHPFVKSILTPWLGMDADKEAVTLGLTTLRTWWQHRRKGESSTAINALRTDKMSTIVDNYTRHFFISCFNLVVVDKEQPPRTLQKTLRTVGKDHALALKKRPTSVNNAGRLSTGSGSSMSSRIIPDTRRNNLMYSQNSLLPQDNLLHHQSQELNALLQQRTDVQQQLNSLQASSHLGASRSTPLGVYPDLSSLASLAQPNYVSGQNSLQTLQSLPGLMNQAHQGRNLFSSTSSALGDNIGSGIGSGANIGGLGLTAMLPPLNHQDPNDHHANLISSILNPTNINSIGTQQSPALSHSYGTASLPVSSFINEEQYPLHDSKRQRISFPEDLIQKSQATQRAHRGSLTTSTSTATIPYVSGNEVKSTVEDQLSNVLPSDSNGVASNNSNIRTSEVDNLISESNLSSMGPPAQDIKSSNFTSLPFVFEDPKGSFAQVGMSIEGLNCHHCVKIVETVLRGCGCRKLPITGLFDAVADSDLGYVVLKIDKAENAKSISDQAARNISMLGYSAHLTEVKVSDLREGITYLSETLPKNVFNWDLQCTCTQVAYGHNTCARHFQMKNGIVDAFKDKVLQHEMLQVKRQMPSSNRLRPDFRGARSRRPGMRNNHSFSMRMSQSSFGRAMSTLSNMSIDWENMDDFDVNVDYSASNGAPGGEGRPEINSGELGQRPRFRRQSALRTSSFSRPDFSVDGKESLKDKSLPVSTALDQSVKFALDNDGGPASV